MGRYPCCKKSADLKKGPWTKEEDEKLANYIHENGIGNWQLVAKRAGLNRCGKSCRLRWTNYLRPDIKRGSFSEEEEKMIIDLHKELGNRWSKIAARLSAGRTDNEVKNYYNTHIKKKLTKLGIDPITHKPFPNLNHLLNSLPNNISFNNNPIISPLDALRLQANITQIANIQLLQNIVQILNYNKNPLPLVQNSVPMMLDNVTTFDNFNVGPNKPHLFDQPFSTTPNSYSVESLLNQPSSMSNSLEFGRGDRNLIVSRILTSNIYNEDDGMMLHSSLPPLVPATPETSNSLEFSHEDKNLVPRVLTSDISNGDDGMMLHSSIPSLVPVTPETSNSEQMFSRGVMKCGDGDGDGDYDFSAWEKVFGDEGNTSLLESIFQS